MKNYFLFIIASFFLTPLVTLAFSISPSTIYNGTSDIQLTGMVAGRVYNFFDASNNIETGVTDSDEGSMCDPLGVGYVCPVDSINEFPSLGVHTIFEVASDSNCELNGHIYAECEADAISTVTFTVLDETAPVPAGGFSALIENAETGYHQTLGDGHGTLMNDVNWIMTSFAKFFMINGLMVLYYLRWWIVALIIIGAVVFYYRRYPVAVRKVK